MPKQRIIGEKPEHETIRVRIQSMSNGRVTKTRSYAIYDEDMKSVARTVEAALQEQYGKGEEMGDEYEIDAPSIADDRPQRKRMKQRLKLRRPRAAANF